MSRTRTLGSEGGSTRVKGFWSNPFSWAALLASATTIALYWLPCISFPGLASIASATGTVSASSEYAMPGLLSFIQKYGSLLSSSGSSTVSTDSLVTALQVCLVFWVIAMVLIALGLLVMCISRRHRIACLMAALAFALVAAIVWIVIVGMVDDYVAQSIAGTSYAYFASYLTISVPIGPYAAIIAAVAGMVCAPLGKRGLREV